MPIQVKYNGSIKTPTNCKVKVGGVWKSCLKSLTKIDGEWKDVWVLLYRIEYSKGATQIIPVLGATPNNSLYLEDIMLYARASGSPYAAHDENISISWSATHKITVKVNGSDYATAELSVDRTTGNLKVAFNNIHPYASDIYLDIGKVVRE